MKLTAPNLFGILDHHVTLPTGETVYNPMRVVGNSDGSEVIFTVYQRPGIADEQFAADVQAVARDLETLRTVLEA